MSVCVTVIRVVLGLTRQIRLPNLSSFDGMDSKYNLKVVGGVLC